MTQITSMTKLGDTIDTSKFARGTVFTQMVIRVGQTGTDANYVVRDADSLGRVWAVNLIPWQLPGNAPANLGATNRNKTVLVDGTSRAKITVGSDGATEDYLVDYPCAGTTVIVSGQMVAVELQGQVPPGVDPTFFPPIIGAYISPASGRPGILSATLTTPTNSIGAGGSQFDGVPPRARAFRVFTGLDPLPAAGLLFTQVDGHLDTLALQDRTNYNDTFFTPSARAQWYPLHPDCQLISIVNRDNVNSASFSVQFLLETAG
jgi:hypothetical protein